MKAGIIGPGAIGFALAAELARRGVQSSFLGRGGPQSARATVHVPGALGATVRIERSAATTAELSQVSLVVVAVKAFDLASALKQVALFPKGVPVIPLANGATEETVRGAAQAMPEYLWRIGFCDFGVSQVGESGERFALRGHKGRAHFGPLLGTKGSEGPSAAEARLIADGGLFCWHERITILQRRKWLYNVVINTLAAAKRLPRNGELLADLPMLAAVFNEALALSVTLWGSWHPPKEELYAGLLALIEDTQNNENSMARDVRLGKKTETAFLAGMAHDRAVYPLLTRLADHL